MGCVCVEFDIDRIEVLMILGATFQNLEKRCIFWISFHSYLREVWGTLNLQMILDIPTRSVARSTLSALADKPNVPLYLEVRNQASKFSK